MDDKELAEIKARADAATPGPWRDDEMDHGNSIEFVAGDPLIKTASGLTVGYCNDEHDATFIASSREDVPALLAEVERLRDALRAVVAAYDALAFDCEMGTGDERVTRARALLGKEQAR